ncbi:MAG: AAA family ATPase [Candidatus Kaelpia imicola]|nr:AAA family ATPase [Candidatus Kaelpia imicola]
MRFKDVEVFGFGKIKDNLRISFAKNINVILAPNDKGKSTLIEFIYAILYPFGDLRTEFGRKKRIKFKPWNSDIYGGRMDFSLDKGGDYRIEKIVESSPREDKLGVFESKNGDFSALKILKQDKHLGLLVGEQFLNISRDVFESLSIVRQFDVAAIGESKKILDEVRSIIEIGKSGGGLSGALKKIQDKKSKIGVFEKRGKRTIAGSKQIEYDQVTKDIEILKQQFSKNRQLLVERRALEVKLEDLKAKLNTKIAPRFEELKDKFVFLFAAIKKSYETIPLMVREMNLKELQNLKKCGDIIKEFKFKFQSIESVFVTAQRALKHNILLFWLSLSGFSIFLVLSSILGIDQAKYLFFSFASFLLIAAFYFLKFIKKEKRVIVNYGKERESFKSEISGKILKFGLFENLEEPKEIDFYEQLWNGLLSELKTSGIEELESIWYQSRDYADTLKKFSELNIEINIKEKVSLKLDFSDVNSDILIFKNSMQTKKDLEDEIRNIQVNISILDKTIENYLPQNDIAFLSAEHSILENEMKRIAIYREALELTSAVLQEAGEELYSEVSPYINDFVNRHFKLLSEEYDFIKVDADLNIYLKPKNYPDFISVEQVGKGMQSSLYLLLRFAIISLFKLNNGEQLPFILDETLNVLDDFDFNHQERLLQLLIDLCYEYDVQMLYFTCQKRGQYLPIKDFFGNRGLSLKENVTTDFTILQGGRDESEFS